MVDQCLPATSAIIVIVRLAFINAYTWYRSLRSSPDVASHTLLLKPKEKHAVSFEFIDYGFIQPYHSAKGQVPLRHKKILVLTPACGALLRSKFFYSLRPCSLG